MTVPRYVYYLPFFSALIAFILSFVGTGCNFLRISTTDTASQPFSIDFGLWYHQSVNVTSSGGIVAGSTCTLYAPDQQVDSTWVAARTFNLIAMILGAAILVFDGCSGCISTNPTKAFRGGAIGYLIASFSSGMSLILLNTNICSGISKNVTLNGLHNNLTFGTCVISTGGKSAIASCVFWFMAAVGTHLLHSNTNMMMMMKKNKLKSSSNNGGEDDGLNEPLVKDYEEDAMIKGNVGVV